MKIFFKIFNYYLFLIFKMIKLGKNEINNNLNLKTEKTTN